MVKNETVTSYATYTARAIYIHILTVNISSAISPSKAGYRKLFYRRVDTLPGIDTRAKRRNPVHDITS